MESALEVILSWGAVLVGALVCIVVGWLLSREVRQRRRGRVSAAIVCGLAVPLMGAVPIIVAVGVRWLGSLAGIALFSSNEGNSGNLVGVGITGIIVAFAAAVLFAVAMLVQALTGSGNPSGGHQR